MLHNPLGNFVADCLANDALRMQMGIKVLHNPASHIIRKLEDDRVGVSWPRRVRAF